MILLFLDVEQDLLKYNTSYILDYYTKKECKAYFDKYNSDELTSMSLNITKTTVARLEGFFFKSERSNNEIFRLLIDLLSKQKLENSSIDLLKFSPVLVFAVLFILLTLIAVFVCCSCSWYSYCPIICRIEKKVKMNYIIILLIINIFFGVNLIYPTIFGIIKLR